MGFEVDLLVRRGDREISAHFQTGPGLTALVGRSGAGKTSILDMVAGLLRPDAGSIRIGDRIVFGPGIDIPAEQRRVGYIFQDVRLFPHLRVSANLRYGEARGPAPVRWLSFDEAVDFLGIGALLDRWPRTLSGGEAQRVAIGRALLSAPHSLLMDEPLSALDATRREEILQVIERIRDELTLPILYVTHDLVEAARLANQQVVIG